MGERQGGEENEMQREGTEMQREGTEMQREGGNLMQNGPGDEKERDCPCWKCWIPSWTDGCWKCWDNCKRFPGEGEERRGLTNEEPNGGVGTETQRGGGEGERGKQMLREDGGIRHGCDLDNHLQGGGWIQLLGEC